MIAKDNLYVVFIILFLIVFTLNQFDVVRIIRRIFIPKKRFEEYDSFLKQYFNYYRLLSEKEKKRFIFRVHNLIQIVRIIGRQGIKVTSQMKLHVLFSQVQLTFGFKSYVLPIFRTVFIYPGSYRNPLTGKLHDGEVNPHGVIIYSWEKLKDGYLNSTDNINLGLHEMAHALMITIIRTDKHDQDLDYYLNEIIKLSKREILIIQNKETHLFRNYAGANIYEFFAVAVEHFFEAPESFKLELPALYMYMTKLLKQDLALKKYRS